MNSVSSVQLRLTKSFLNIRAEGVKDLRKIKPHKGKQQNTEECSSYLKKKILVLLTELDQI